MRFIKMLLFPLLLFSIMSGCAVLTTSQIQEVQNFALIVHESSKFPGAVMRAHADLREKNKLMNASGAMNGQNALRFLKTKAEYSAQYNSLIDRADNACQILMNYADLLLKLTDTSYPEKIQSSAVQIAKSLDESIKTYNAAYGASLGLSGGKVAAVLSSAGSLYIKRRQSIVLKQTVIEASPVIFEMTNAISDLLDLYINPENKLIEKEKEYIENWYMATGYEQPLSTTEIVARQLEAADEAILLARESKNAIENINSAHVILVEKVKKKTELNEDIEIINLLIKEVKEAKQLKEKLEQN